LHWKNFGPGDRLVTLIFELNFFIPHHIERAHREAHHFCVPKKPVLCWFMNVASAQQFYAI